MMRGEEKKRWKVGGKGLLIVDIQQSKLFQEFLPLSVFQVSRCTNTQASASADASPAACEMAENAYAACQIFARPQHDGDS